MRKIGWIIVLLIGLLFFGKTKIWAIVPGECRWCGSTCAFVSPGMNCIDIAPPEGMLCIETGGKCIAQLEKWTCGWCGGYCKTIYESTICPIAPTPEGAECVDMGGTCVGRSVLTPTPAPFEVTPTVSVCKEGVNSFSVDTACGTGLFRYANYSCYGPKKGRMGTDTTCKSSESWYSEALRACVGFGSCTVTPTKASTTCKSCPYGTVKSGDANCDKIVDLVDFTIWKGEYISGKGTMADFNCDGKVDLVDFSWWKTGYLNITILPQPLTSTPAPPPPYFTSTPAPPPPYFTSTPAPPPLP